MGLLQGERASLYNRIDHLVPLLTIEQDKGTMRLRCHLQGLATRFRNLVSRGSDKRWSKMRRQAQFASSVWRRFNPQRRFASPDSMAQAMVGANEYGVRSVNQTNEYAARCHKQLLIALYVSGTGMILIRH